METKMQSQQFNYPDHVDACHFCAGVDVVMNADLLQIEGTLQVAFTLECTSCKYKTKAYIYPDIAVHAWNMARKIVVMDLVNTISHTKNKADD